MTIFSLSLLSLLYSVHEFGKKENPWKKISSKNIVFIPDSTAYTYDDKTRFLTRRIWRSTCFPAVASVIASYFSHSIWSEKEIAEDLWFDGETWRRGKVITGIWIGKATSYLQEKMWEWFLVISSKHNTLEDIKKVLNQWWQVITMIHSQSDGLHYVMILDVTNDGKIIVRNPSTPLVTTEWDTLVFNDGKSSILPRDQLPDVSQVQTFSEKEFLGVWGIWALTGFSRFLKNIMISITPAQYKVNE